MRKLRCIFRLHNLLPWGQPLDDEQILIYSNRCYNCGFTITTAHPKISDAPKVAFFVRPNNNLSNDEMTAAAMAIATGEDVSFEHYV